METPEFVLSLCVFIFKLFNFLSVNKYFCMVSLSLDLALVEY